MAELKLLLFGSPCFELNSSLVAIPERKAIALLTYLAVSGTRHSRDSLATMLWPKQSQAKARADLRHAIWSLRNVGLGEWITADEGHLAIRPRAWQDVAEFSRLIELTKGHICPIGTICPECLDNLTQAAALYQDDFLTGFTLRDAPQFDEWQYYHQERLRQELSFCLSRLVQWHSQKADWAEAIRFARRWVALDSLDEKAQRWLIKTYALSGKRSLAMKQYDALKNLLKQEWGSSPESLTVSLAEAIQSGGPFLSSLFFSPAASSRFVDQLSDDRPDYFLERTVFMNQLVHRLEEVRQGRGRIIFLGAEAGGGKTTLIRHLCAKIQEMVRISIGVCDPLSTPQPLGPLWDIATSLGGDLIQSMRSEVEPEKIFRSFLEELRNKQIVQLVVFEDIHWSDEATLDLLRFITRRIESTRALVIVSFRVDQVDSQHPFRVLLGDLATSAGMVRMHLPPLSKEAVKVMVAGSGLDPDEVHRRTGGNPYFVTEMLNSGVDGIPENVRDVILARVARLTQTARTALESAAILGPRAEADLLVEMDGVEAGLIEMCISAGILLAKGHTVVFRHDLAWQTVLDDISPLRLLGYHRQALDVLKASAQGSSDLSRLAHHAEGAADAMAVLQYAPAAARQAAVAGAHRQAAAQFERALRFSSGLPAKERAQLLSAYGRECFLCDQMHMALQAYEQSVNIWEAAGNRLEQGDNLIQQANCLIGLGRSTEASRYASSAIEILTEYPDSPQMAHAYSQQASLSILKGDHGTTISLAQQAIHLAERTGEYKTLISSLNTIGTALLYKGDPSGRLQLERSIALAQEMNDQAGVARGYCNLGCWVGRLYGWDPAGQMIAKGLKHCTEFELDFYRYYLLAMQADAYLHQGYCSQAEEAAQSILKIPDLAVDTRFWAYYVLGLLAARRGDRRSGEILEQALGMAKKFEVLMFQASARAARAEALWLAGKTSQIQDEVREVYALAIQHRDPWYSGELAFWLWRAGEQVDPPEWVPHVFVQQIRGNWAAAAAEWEHRKQPYEQAWALADGDRGARLTALEIFETLGAASAAALLRSRIQLQA